MGWQPGADGGTGGEPGPGLPGGRKTPGPERDPRLAGFAQGGAWDACGPSAALAMALEGVSGPERQCPGA